MGLPLLNPSNFLNYCQNLSIKCSLVILLAPHPTLALPPDDFQLFAAIFFVLLAVGFVISVAFAGALYFFFWYNRRKKAVDQSEANQFYGESNGYDGPKPIQWITTTYREGPTMAGLQVQPPSPQIYPANWPAMATGRGDQQQGREEPIGGSGGPSVPQRLVASFKQMGNSMQTFWRRIVEAIPTGRNSSQPSTIFPTIVRGSSGTISPSSPPSYISAQSPAEMFTNWASSPQQPKRMERQEQQQAPKSILKKPRIRWPNGNGRKTMEGQMAESKQKTWWQQQQQQPIVMPIPIQRGIVQDVGRRPPHIPRQWEWHPKLATTTQEGDGSQRIVEDRLEREESCVKGRLVAVERLTRTTTTTKMLDNQGGGNWTSGGPNFVLQRTFI